MPPKRMTANPVRPARYRPGKPIAADASESESEEPGSEESGSESDSPPPAPLPKPVFKKKVAAPALKDVDLSKRFDAAKKAEEQRVKEEEEKKKEAEGSADEYTTEESSGEEESDGDDDEEEEEEEVAEASRKVFHRPTFVPKAQRGEKVVKKEDEEGKERQRLEAEELLELHLKRDAAAKAAGRKGWDDDDDPDGLALDDIDGTDPPAERAAWKLRELTRVKREREALTAIEAERAEIERRREMDPALRDREDREFVREQQQKKMESQGKMGFMQKFYHKGAFFQDADIPERNYATAEVEDRVKNREVLPKYLQVRGDEVGKRGRTRWTHLAAEDTSMQAGGSPWFEKKGGFGGGARGGGFAGGTGVNSVPVVAGVDERFRPDNDRARGAGGGREQRERDEDGKSERRPAGERSSRWDARDRTRDHRPRDHGDRDRDRDHKPRSRWDDGGGRGTSRVKRRGDGGGGGDSYNPDGREDRKRPPPPHSPPRGGEKEKRRRRDASPV